MFNIMDDIEFEYISEDEVLEDSALNEDFEPRFFWFNHDGKNFCGKDFNCAPKIEIFSFVHSENIHPKFRKSDGALSITNAGNEVFGSCEPSSNTNQSQSSFKDLAKERLKSRFDISNISFFDKFMKIRKSCHLIEHVNDEFYCDCAGGSIARQCKHSAGLMFKMKILQIDSDVRSKPLGQKRKRGWPKKLPLCLARSPEQPAKVS